MTSFLSACMLSIVTDFHIYIKYKIGGAVCKGVCKVLCRCTLVRIALTDDSLSVLHLAVQFKTIVSL